MALGSGLLGLDLGLGLGLGLGIGLGLGFTARRFLVKTAATCHERSAHVKVEDLASPPSKFSLVRVRVRIRIRVQVRVRSRY